MLRVSYPVHQLTIVQRIPHLQPTVLLVIIAQETTLTPVTARMQVSTCIFLCRLLITFANFLDTYQDRQNDSHDLDPNCLTLR